MSQLLPATEVQDAIILCVEIVNLNFSRTTQPIAKKEAWLKLHSAVEDWRMYLITGVQPILTIHGVKAAESEHISTSFPVVIYTNRPHFYTSFLFHLSCLLLLQCRPHSLRRAKNTCLKTVSYHAVYLCGVSKSNRLAYSWDPILIAGLLYAGKYLSYCRQQIELLQQLEALAELTGWKMRKEIQRLQEIWKASQ